MKKLTALWLVLAALLVARQGAAQTTTTTTTPTTPTTNKLGVTKSDFNPFRFQYRDDQGNWVDMNKTTFETYFNRGNCECNRPVRVIITLVASSRNKLKVTAASRMQLRIGDSTCVCQDNTTCKDSLCKLIGNPLPLTDLVNGNASFEITVKDVFAGGQPAATATSCERSSGQGVYLWMDGDDPDQFSDVQDVSEALNVDGVGPEGPMGMQVTSGSGALVVSWILPSAVTDEQGYQVLCGRGNETNTDVMPVFNSAQKTVFQARYTSATCAPTKTTTTTTTTTTMSAQTSGTDVDAGATDAGADDAAADGGASAGAGATQDAAATASDATLPPDAPGPKTIYGFPPAKLAELNPLYACSNLLTAQDSVRIKGLENGIPYAVALVRIDKLGNPSPITQAALARPTATRDFYTGYRAAGGQADGGCSVTGARGAHAGWALGAGALAGLLARRRRRGALVGRTNVVKEERAR
jgi:MYXO-CTERM domain-containing protein